MGLASPVGGAKNFTTVVPNMTHTWSSYDQSGLNICMMSHPSMTFIAYLKKIVPNGQLLCDAM